MSNGTSVPHTPGTIRTDDLMTDEDFVKAIEAMGNETDTDIGELLKAMNENRIISWEEAERILMDTSSAPVKSSLPEQVRPTEPDNDTDVDQCIQKLLDNDPHLKEINLNNMKRTPIPQIRRLLEAMAYNEHCERLSLANMGLYDNDIAVLLTVIEMNTALRKLNLETNYLSGDFFAKLFRAALVNQTLEEVKAVNQGVSFATLAEKEIIDCIVANTGLLKISVNLRLPEGRHKIENATLRNGEYKRILRREAAKKAKYEAEELAKNPVPHLPKESKEPKKPATKPSAKEPLAMANDVKEAVVQKPSPSSPDKKLSTKSVTSSVNHPTISSSANGRKLSLLDSVEPIEKDEIKEKVEKEPAIPKKKIDEPLAQKEEKKKTAVTSRVAALSSRFSVADSNAKSFLDMSSGGSAASKNVDSLKKSLVLPKNDKTESDKPSVKKRDQNSNEVTETPRGETLQNEPLEQAVVENGQESEMKNLAVKNEVNVPKRSLSKEKKVRKPAKKVEKTDDEKVEKTSAAKTNAKQKKVVRKVEKNDVMEKPLTSSSERKTISNKSEFDIQQHTTRNTSEEVKSSRSLPIEKEVTKSASMATLKKSKGTSPPEKLITTAPKLSNGVLPSGKQAIGNVTKKSLIKGIMSKFEPTNDSATEKKDFIKSPKAKKDNLPRAFPEREKSPEKIKDNAPAIEPHSKMTKRKRDVEKNAATGKRAMMKNRIGLNDTG